MSKYPSFNEFHIFPPIICKNRTFSLPSDKCTFFSDPLTIIACFFALLKSKSCFFLQFFDEIQCFTKILFTRFSVLQRSLLRNSVFYKDPFYEIRFLFATLWQKSQIFSQFFDGIFEIFCGHLIKFAFFLKSFDEILIVSQILWQN